MKEALTEAANKGAAPKGGWATVEQTYQKLTQHQHPEASRHRHRPIEEAGGEMFVMDQLAGW